MKRIALLALVALLSFSRVLSQLDPLQQGFLHPPESSRPWAYWVWVDGNLTSEGITADLEAMKSAGIGGVIIMEVNVGMPRGSVDFMGTSWRSLFRHAVAESERLGLQVTLMTGPGWAGSGGPWVRPEASMMHIVSRDTVVTGPTRFDGTLKQPARWPAFFGDGLLPPELEKQKNEFYRDVTVLAFPTPEVSQKIPGIDEKALYVRAPYSSQLNVKPFLPFPDAFPGLPPNQRIAPSTVIDLSKYTAANGHLRWDVPPGRWTIMRFGNTSTGATTRPAPVPGLGMECDKLDTAALNAHFEAFIGSLLRELGPRKQNAEAGWSWLHIDSWEMGAQNWTPKFREEFRRLRGYDLYPYLPVTAGYVVGSPEISERFLWDFRQTAQDLLIRNHALHLKELGQRNGFRLSIEPYDMTPCSDMAYGGVADVPMGEFWLYGFNTYFSVIEAASIAHTNGKAVVAAEAFTSLDQEHWLAHPASMKGLGDWAFSAGVNRFVFHRWQHQPWLLLRPGTTMGPFGVHWEQTQTWWSMVPAYHTYLARCQYLLRQGLPVADVCFLVAEGAPHVFNPPSSAMKGTPPDFPGYRFDGCAPDLLLARMAVKDGRLVLPDGMSYRVLVLPERETMTPTLLRKVRDLVDAGATVVGPRVRKSPSLSDYPACDDEIRKLSADLWGDIDGVHTTERRFGKGRVIWKAPEPSVQAQGDSIVALEQYGDYDIVTSLLRSSGVRPDFESEIPLRFIHRRDGERDIYFVANPSDGVVLSRCHFRVSGKSPQLWDAVTGEIRNFADYTDDHERISVVLRLEPFESCFVVFSANAPEPTAAGHHNPHLTAISTLAGEWNVLFDRSLGGPGLVTFETLTDWTSRSEEGVRYYSGVATYSKTIDLSFAEDEARGKSRWWIDLGLVHNVARIRINGRDAGVAWCAPWRVEITNHIQRGPNKLEIDVANLWLNRLIGDEFQPPDAEYGKRGNLMRWPEWLLRGEQRPSKGRIAFSTWRHFTKDTPLLPSGLLGPVRVLKSGN